jgi:hypothetical protein
MNTSNNDNSSGSNVNSSINFLTSPPLSPNKSYATTSANSSSRGSNSSGSISRTINRKKSTPIAAACDSCRKRHRQCDKVQPVCGLCKKYDRTCIWPIRSTAITTSLSNTIDNESNNDLTTFNEANGLICPLSLQYGGDLISSNPSNISSFTNNITEEPMSFIELNTLQSQQQSMPKYKIKRNYCDISCAFYNRQQ